MSFLTTRTARSMMYLFGIGGLLVCNGFIVAMIWNEVLYRAMGNEHHLSFLEGIGITAFAYVGVFALKYGGVRGQRPVKPQSVMAKRCAEMTADQRAALRQELVQTCGCKETETK